MTQNESRALVVTAENVEEYSGTLKTTGIDAFASIEQFEAAYRVAKMLSSSTIVPKDYQGQNGIPNCMIALNMAMLMQTNPLLVMQNLYVVNGRPAWSSQFLIAKFNASGRFSRINYQMLGEAGTPSFGCRAISKDKETGEKIQSIDITMAMAQAEGWVNKSGSKWKTFPEQMLRYRAASFLIRAYYPELAFGFEEAE